MKNRNPLAPLRRRLVRLLAWTLTAAVFPGMERAAALPVLASAEPPSGTASDARLNPTIPCMNLEMHPFLYAGEFQKQGTNYFDDQKVYLVRNGKVAWTYTVTKASVGGKLVELGDISMKSNGHVVMSLGWGGAREIIPDYTNPANSEVVWSCRADEQIHTAQPVGNDKVFVIDNSRKPKAKLFDRTTGPVRVWDLPTVGTDAHATFRQHAGQRQRTSLGARGQSARPGRVGIQ